MSERESMQYDVVVVGAGPAGLATAIHLKQLCAKDGKNFSVCVVEKGSEVGAHILSGAVIDPRALAELFPDWKDRGAPLNQPVTEDRFLFLSERGARQVPHFMLPGCFRNEGNYIASLGNVARWLGQQAEALGVEIFAGFAAAEVLYTEDGKVRGVATGDMGIGKTGERTSRFQPGVELHARYTVFAEGCRGHLGKGLEARYRLREGASHQVYGIGLKELWEVAPEKHVPGLVVHTAGWPLDAGTYGGSFLYHLENRQVAVGFVVGLGYENPYLHPFEEFQRYKTHPAIRTFFEGGRRIAYGARAIAAGGLQSLPKLMFPGGVLVGDDAGFLNAARIKGSHAAIKSGMLAAQAAFDALAAGRAHDELAAYPEAFRSSWLHDELHRARNFKPAMSMGLYRGAFLVGVDQIVFRGKAPR
jgi:electron-transferring-flavoprotein dehydrogenase